MIATVPAVHVLDADTSDVWPTVSVTTAVTTGTVVLHVTAAGSGAPFQPPSKPRRPRVEKSAVDQRREFLQRQREHARRPR